MTNQDPIARTLQQTAPPSRCIGTKRSRILRSLAFSASLACLLPISLSAKDKGEEQDKHDKKEGKGAGQHHGKGSPNQSNPAAQGAPPVAVQGGKSRSHAANPGIIPQGQVSVPRGVTRGATQNGNAGTYAQPEAQQAIRGSNRGSYVQQIQNPLQFAPPQGTRENRYGGQWIPGDSHSDWGRSGEHYWNHRHYRWYDGGWLIIATGNDQGYERGYSTHNSVARNVQRRLAEQGYYNGPIDGDIGPGSRRAIADYQNANGLRATGRISDSLLVSLGLE